METFHTWRGSTSSLKKWTFSNTLVAYHNSACIVLSRWSQIIHNLCRGHWSLAVSSWILWPARMIQKIPWKHLKGSTLNKSTTPDDFSLSSLSVIFASCLAPRLCSNEYKYNWVYHREVRMGLYALWPIRRRTHRLSLNLVRLFKIEAIYLRSSIYSVLST